MPNSTKLLFPPISARIKVEDGQKFIWDSSRQKWLVLTPEEWVRRHVVDWLVSEKGISALSISQEYPVNINGLNQRADIVVIDESAKPYLLVECKAPQVPIDEAVVMQACRYNAVVEARYVMLTNGVKVFCYEYQHGRYRPVRDFR
jgi:hypothetical protein